MVPVREEMNKDLGQGSSSKDERVRFYHLWSEILPKTLDVFYQVVRHLLEEVFY